jgi:hypothetical protein
MLTLEEVFKTQGVPSITYVSRDDGRYEQDLSEGLLDAGTIVVLSGPSKTGKTVLVRKVAEKLGKRRLEVACSREMSAEEVWRRCLEALDFERITELMRQKGSSINTEAEIEGHFGWQWLAGLIGRAKLGLTKNSSEEESRERILAAPNPSHIIPLLQRLPLLLVVENFHYLSDDVKEVLFQQWRQLTDNEVSSVLLGTSHRVIDLVRANKDITGRVVHIRSADWSDEELRLIGVKGFRALGVRVPREIVAALVRESVGIPLLMQALCRRLMQNLGVLDIRSQNLKQQVDISQVYTIMHEEALKRYQAIYDPMFRHLVGDADQQRTVSWLLSCFLLEPLAFSLRIEEIEERLTRLPQTVDLSAKREYLLVALEQLSDAQKVLDVELLDWDSKSKCLYITEPLFLFFIRWREKRETRPFVLPILDQLWGPGQA